MMHSAERDPRLLADMQRICGCLYAGSQVVNMVQSHCNMALYASLYNRLSQLLHTANKNDHKTIHNNKAHHPVSFQCKHVILYLWRHIRSSRETTAHPLTKLMSFVGRV